MIRAGLTTDPEIRITAHLFEQCFGAPPARIRSVPAPLILLGGAHQALTVALRWGTIAAIGPPDRDSIDLRSANHLLEPFTARPGHLPAAHATGEVPAWAEPVVAALLTRSPAPGVRLLVNRGLPAQTRLSNGGETTCVVARLLDDMYGPGGHLPGGPEAITARHAHPGHALLVSGDDAEPLPCDLLSAGLRLLITELGVSGTAEAHTAPPDLHPTLIERAADVLRTRPPAALGPLLDQGHARGEPALDLVLDTARDAGALGGLTIGNCAVALTPAASVPHIQHQITEQLTPRTRRPPRFLTIHPVGTTARTLGCDP